MSKSKAKPVTTTSIAEEIQQLRAMDVSGLVDRYEAVFGKPPRVNHRDWLWRRIAWKIQEQRFGGLSGAAKTALDALIAELDLPLGAPRTVRGTVNGPARDGHPVVGTTLTRIWKGREILATRTEEGWDSEGLPYRSLSAVAKAITGSHMSGPAFFGLTKRKGMRK